ncbi:MAG TPA: alpha/beta hydrolase-fold protein [Byssovorax sp.]
MDVARRKTLGLLASLALAACKSRSGASTAGPHAPDDQARVEKEKSTSWRDLAFDAPAGLPDGEAAMVLVPDAAADKPVLVALHGRGESGNGTTIGARAWPIEYELDRLERRLHAPPITSADLGDVVDAARLARINALLADKAYAGMTVACPYAPWQPDRADAFQAFVVDALLPKARAEAKATAARERTGIDGVSMGGRLALLVGLGRPDVFASVGALQPAVKADEAPMWSDLAQRAMARAPIKLRLVTTDKDVFREAVEAIAARLAQDNVPHELVVVPGEHGYAWNRGAGGLEMLFWHERMLRGLPGA